MFKPPPLKYILNIHKRLNPLKYLKGGKLRLTDDDDNLDMDDAVGVDDDDDDEDNDSEDGGYYTDTHHHHHHHHRNRHHRSHHRHRSDPSFLTSLLTSCRASRHRRRKSQDSDETASLSPHTNPIIRLVLNLFSCCLRAKSTELGSRENSENYETAAINSSALVPVKPKKSNLNSVLEEYVERPPVTCIRVLRPSNDLTPVRFDSHYNIIQAVSSGSFSGASGLPSPPSSEANKSAVDVISSIMEDAIKQQVVSSNDFVVSTYTKV